MCLRRLSPYGSVGYYSAGQHLARLWDRKPSRSLFGLQEVEDSRFRARVLPDLWRSCVGGIVDRFLLLPMWACRGGVRGGRIDPQARPLFRVLTVVWVALRNWLWCQGFVGYFLC